MSSTSTPSLTIPQRLEALQATLRLLPRVAKFAAARGEIAAMMKGLRAAEDLPVDEKRVYLAKLDGREQAERDDARILKAVNAVLETASAENQFLRAKLEAAMKSSPAGGRFAAMRRRLNRI